MPTLHAAPEHLRLVRQIAEQPSLQRLGLDVAATARGQDEMQIAVTDIAHVQKRRTLHVTTATLALSRGGKAKRIKVKAETEHDTRLSRADRDETLVSNLARALLPFVEAMTIATRTITMYAYWSERPFADAVAAVLRERGYDVTVRDDVLGSDDSDGAHLQPGPVSFRPHSRSATSQTCIARIGTRSERHTIRVTIAEDATLEEAQTKLATKLAAWFDGFSGVL